MLGLFVGWRSATHRSSPVATGKREVSFIPRTAIAFEAMSTIAELHVG
jgi:hypothetical protein